MAILTPPTTPGYRAARWVLQGNTIEHVSPLTRAVQVIEAPGARWMATLTLPPMKRAEAEAWSVFLLQLRGRAGRFYAGDPSAATPRGTATGTPVVSGASQTGIRLNTSGWTGGVTGILLAGDFVAWDTPSGWRELHMVIEDATSAAGGTATLKLSPPIRESPATGETVITTAATCVMQLASDQEARWSVDEALIHDIVFNCEEAFVDAA